MGTNARLGLRFFVVYAALYLAFVLMNAFSPNTMELTPWAGVSLAVTSGLGLIGFAFVLALIYGVICGSVDREQDSARGPRP